MWLYVFALVACGVSPPAPRSPARVEEGAPATTTAEGIFFVGVSGIPAHGGYVSVQEYQRYDALDRLAGWGTLEPGAEQALALARGMAVAEIGCGPGPGMRRFAEAVGTSGKVYEVDVDPNALAFIERRLARIESVTGKPLPHVVTVKSSFSDVGLSPGSIDRAYLQEVHNYAFLPHATTPELARARYEAEQGAWTRSVHAALRPGGRLVIAEMRPEVNRGATYGLEETVAFIEGTRLFRRLPTVAADDTRHYLLLFERVDTLTEGAPASVPQTR